MYLKPGERASSECRGRPSTAVSLPRRPQPHRLCDARSPSRNAAWLHTGKPVPEEVSVVPAGTRQSGPTARKARDATTARAPGRRVPRSGTAHRGRLGPAVRAHQPGRAHQGEGRRHRRGVQPGQRGPAGRRLDRAGHRRHRDLERGGQQPAIPDHPWRPRRVCTRPAPGQASCRPRSTTTHWRRGSPGATWSRGASWH